MRPIPGLSCPRVGNSPAVRDLGEGWILDYRGDSEADDIQVRRADSESNPRILVQFRGFSETVLGHGLRTTCAP